MAFKKNATYKELFEALEAIATTACVSDMINPDMCQVPMKHVARAARIVEGAKAAGANPTIIKGLVMIERGGEFREAFAKLPKVRAKAIKVPATKAPRIREQPNE